METPSPIGDPIPPVTLEQGAAVPAPVVVVNPPSPPSHVTDQGISPFVKVCAIVGAAVLGWYAYSLVKKLSKKSNETDAR